MEYTIFVLWCLAYFTCHLFIMFYLPQYINNWLPWQLSGKESACNSGDTGSIPGSGRSPGEGNGNPLQYSCLEKPTDRGAWQATVHGVTEELDTT